MGRSLDSDRIPRTELDEGGERRVGWRGAVGAAESPLPRVTIPAAAGTCAPWPTVLPSHHLPSLCRARGVLETCLWRAEAQRRLASPRPLSVAFPWRFWGHVGAGGRAGQRVAEPWRAGSEGRAALSAPDTGCGGTVAAVLPLSRQQFSFLIPAPTAERCRNPSRGP